MEVGNRGNPFGKSIQKSRSLFQTNISETETPNQFYFPDFNFHSGLERKIRSTKIKLNCNSLEGESRFAGIEELLLRFEIAIQKNKNKSRLRLNWNR